MTFSVSLAALLALPALALAQPLAMQRHGELRLACGGVGAEERAQLARIGAGANLEILFVTARRGAYLSGARVSIEPAARRAGGAEIVAEGPTCYVLAPPGAYRVRARLEGVERAVSVRVPAAGARPARAVLSFPDEPWDGIRASDEERRQAREP